MLPTTQPASTELADCVVLLLKRVIKHLHNMQLKTALARDSLLHPASSSLLCCTLLHCSTLWLLVFIVILSNYNK
ncbi:hypothetical protein EXN66_Car019836 [Channa argus]|uniref:Uncharacterized protein n=1 Tax=Channa argus TaxID=215402 RepID=A0A6G1QPJ4_CHAAH|nr:hypothetical protein EXN66_Car019836 [Channa argus]